MRSVSSRVDVTENVHGDIAVDLSASIVTSSWTPFVDTMRSVSSRVDVTENVHGDICRNPC